MPAFDDNTDDGAATACCHGGAGAKPLTAESLEPLMSKELRSSVVQPAAVPYQGLCSKGGLCALLVYLPTLLLAAAVVACLATGAGAAAVAYCVAGWLVLSILVFVFIYFCADNAFQIWALQHPGNLASLLIIPPLTIAQALESCNNEWMHKRRLDYGPNFCAAGEVCLGEYAEVQRALLEPQARTYRLGQTPFIKAHCPGGGKGERELFLLALSDEGAGGDGSNQKFRKCMEHYLLGHKDTESRRQDDVAKGLVARVASDYASMPRAEFFKDPKYQGGLELFIIEYFTYVLFGLQPSGADLEVLTKFFGGDMGTSHYIKPLGYILNYSKVIDQVDAIYEKSPALKDFEICPAFGNMTKQELVLLMTSVIRIAAKTGTYQLARSVLGDAPLPRYAGEATGDVDVPKLWDELDLNNRPDVRKYILEVARLYPPVNVVHRVATQTFSVDFQGQQVAFPAGTTVMVPACYGNLDKGFWGPTAFEFNAQRENLERCHMGFNSVGSRSGGRICPGKDLALETLTDLVASVGKVRRAAGSGGSAA